LGATNRSRSPPVNLGDRARVVEGRHRDQLTATTQLCGYVGGGRHRIDDLPRHPRDGLCRVLIAARRLGEGDR